MKNNASDKIEVSIILVNYRVKQELFTCIRSVKKSRSDIIYELVIVDNDEKSYIEKELKQEFSDVLYIKSQKNLGYGAGNNLGAKYARGKYLFFLNPDTQVLPEAISILVKFLEKNTNVAITAPLFLNKKNKPYFPQGSKRLTPLRAVFTLSFLHRLFPNNVISKEYLIYDWDKTGVKEVDVVPGTAFVIRKEIFEKIGGFDENFFLYFEEFDLCNRVKELGFKIFILPNAKVKHLWEVSTKRASFDVAKVFRESRFYYFKKYYGVIPAFLMEVLLRLNKTYILLGLILTLGAFLRFYKLEELMPFIGDQGWFYLSARDIVLKGSIPLVGITSSHTWLHQGPLWTYMLSVVLWLFNFNPVSGAYLTSFLGIITILVLYVACSIMFSKKLAIIASCLYAVSPLVVFHSRFAYHTSPIPLFTVLFILFLYKWISGKNPYFPFAIFILSILYNLELATVSLGISLIGILVYGLYKKKTWAIRVYNKRIVFLAFLFFILPMVPIFIYDFNHGFSQTGGFMAWIGYKIIKFLNPFEEMFFSTNGTSMANFLYKSIHRLLFLPDARIALLFFLSSIFYFFYSLYKMYKYNRCNIGYVLISYLLTVATIGFIVSQTSSEAYLPIFFPLIIIMSALLIFYISEKIRFFHIGGLFLIFIMAVNSYSIIKEYHNTQVKGLTFTDRINASRKIVQHVDGKEYVLIGSGWLSEFENYTMNYQYLTWWLGNEPSKLKKKLRIVISEDNNDIQVRKETK